MRSTIISLGLFNHTGGPTKTIGDFKRALGAELYAFCEKSIFEKYKLSVKGAHPVTSSSLPLLSQYCYTKKGAKAAEVAIKESEIVSCHSFYRYHALWTNRICNASRVPYSFVPHGILDPWVMRKNRWIKHLYLSLGGRRFIEDASVLIFSTQTEKDKATTQFTLGKSEVIPWAVEPVEVTYRDKKRVQIREKLGIPKEAHVLLYFGRLHPIKRPLETIEAVAKANSENIHIVIVGNEDGITKTNCMQCARKCRFEKCIHFIGPIYGEKKYDYMHAADAYISLSFKENFNYTAAESLAAGLPVILSPGNNLRSELSGVGCCFNIEDNMLQSATNSICDFYDLSLPKLQQMGMLGRKWVEENLSFNLFEKRVVELHKNCAKG